MCARFEIAEARTVRWYHPKTEKERVSETEWEKKEGEGFEKFESPTIEAPIDSIHRPELLQRVQIFRLLRDELKESTLCEESIFFIDCLIIIYFS